LLQLVQVLLPLHVRVHVLGARNKDVTRLRILRSPDMRSVPVRITRVGEALKHSWLWRRTISCLLRQLPLRQLPLLSPGLALQFKVESAVVHSVD
jgi:hypothetical protein